MSVIDRRNRDGGCQDDIQNAPDEMFTDCVGPQFEVRSMPQPAGDEAIPVDVNVSAASEGSPMPAFGTFADSEAGNVVSVDDTEVVAGGYESGFVIGASTSRRSIAWATSIGDNAFVSPTVLGRTVLVAPQAGSVVALDALTGAERWELPLASNLFARPPTLWTTPDGDQILFVGASTDFEGDVTPSVVYAMRWVPVALVPETLWATELDPGGNLDWPHPVVADGVVIVRDIPNTFDETRQAHLYGIDARTGERLWARTLDLNGYGTPAPIVSTDGIGIFHLSPQTIEGFDPATGESIWQLETPAFRPIETGTNNTILLRGATTEVVLDAATGNRVD